MYETGYSPYKSLLPILGDYAHYMMYPPNTFNYFCKSFIEQAMERPFIRHQFTSVLKNLVGTCKYPEKGKKIICQDVLNPHAIPDLDLYFEPEEHKWTFSHENNEQKSTNKGTYILIQDDRFLLAIQLNKEVEHLEVYIYRK